MAPALSELQAREEARFVESHPRSRALAEQARETLFEGVPMHWMRKWPGGFPVFVREARGARFVDVDGIEYVDFCLGDTGAMTGHAPEPTLKAIEEQAARGITLMLPTEDALVVAAELTRRFGVSSWQFALTATDANRFSIRLARHLTGRPKVLVFNWCYHGTVDETFATLADGVVGPRSGNLGPPVNPAETTRVVEFNDVDALERELSHGDVAVVLTEPALTNVGIVHPEPGFHDALRELTRRSGALLAIDETHTICCGPGGFTAAHGLRARHRHDREADRRGSPGSGVRLLRGRGRASRGHDRAGRRRRGRCGRDARGECTVARRDAGDARRGSHRERLR